MKIIYVMLSVCSDIVLITENLSSYKKEFNLLLSSLSFLYSSFSFSFSILRKEISLDCYDYIKSTEEAKKNEMYFFVL